MSGIKYDPITGEPIVDIEELEEINSPKVPRAKDTQFPKAVHKSGLSPKVLLIILSIPAIIAFFCVSILFAPRVKSDNKVVVSDDSESASADDEEIEANRDHLFRINIDNNSYNFPLQVSELLDSGWKYKDYKDSDIQLASGETEYLEILYNNVLQYNITIWVKNFSMNKQPISNCYITEITLRSETFAKMEKTVTTHEGAIILGKTSEDALMKYLGEPDEANRGRGSSALCYYENETVSILDPYIKFEFTGDILTSIHISNDSNPIDAEDYEVNHDVPEYLNSYSAPDSLGSDYQSGNIEIEGQLYTMPIPLSALVDNGWVLTYKRNNTPVGAGATEFCQIAKDGKWLSVTCTNMSDEVTDLINTVVTQFYISENGDKTPDYMLPGDLGGTFTRDDLISYLTDNNITNYNCSDDRKHFYLPMYDSNMKLTIDAISFAFNEDGSFNYLCYDYSVWDK